MPNDGPKPLSEPERLDHEIESELRNWANAQMSPDSLNIQVWRLDFKVTTLIELCMELFDVSEDDVNIKFKNVMLRELRGLRAELQPQVEENRRKAMIQKDMPKIQMPKGF